MPDRSAFSSAVRDKSMPGEASMPCCEDLRMPRRILKEREAVDDLGKVLWAKEAAWSSEMGGVSVRERAACLDDSESVEPCTWELEKALRCDFLWSFACVAWCSEPVDMEGEAELDATGVWDVGDVTS